MVAPKHLARGKEVLDGVPLVECERLVDVTRVPCHVDRLVSTTDADLVPRVDAEDAVIESQTDDDSCVEPGSPRELDEESRNPPAVSSSLDKDPVRTGITHWGDGSGVVGDPIGDPIVHRSGAVEGSDRVVANVRSNGPDTCLRRVRHSRNQWMEGA